MNITFTHINIQNFCGTRSLNIDLTDRTIIKGVNACGKSTIKNAIYWVLFDKLADGSQATGIRPHDENGNDINMIDIVVELTMVADGKSITIKKAQKQNWVTDRTTREQTFKGNVNEYEVNGIPKKQKDFYEYLNDYIDPDVFMFCTNPQVFLKLDAKNRRAKLFELVGDVDSQVIDSDPKFDSLKNDLMDGTVEELLSRSQKAKKELTKTLELIPARIDELSLQLVDVDVDELEKSKAVYKDGIAKEEAKIADYDKADAEYNSLHKELMEAEDEVRRIEHDTERTNLNAQSEANQKVQSLIRDIAVVNSYVKSDEDALKRYEEEKKRCEKDLESYRERWNTENAMTFDENSAICPTCGRKLAESKIKEAMKSFDEVKAKHLADFERSADEVKQMIKSIDSKVKVVKEEHKDHLKKIENMNAEKTIAEGQAFKVTSIDVNSLPEYKAALKKADSIKKKLEKANSSAADKQKCLADIKTMNEAIATIDVQLAKVITNEQIKSRMQALEDEQIATSQKIANEEMKIDLLKEFNRMRVNLATEQINAYFSVIKWQMFKQQINGDYAEVCIPIVCTDNSNATSYDGLLNHGNKILADIDLCQAFQKANSVVCPIIIDDSESVDADRIPVTENQLIVLRRTDDKTLTVEALK